MQRDRITPGNWYQTKQGEARCINVSVRGAKMQAADGTIFYVKPAEVQYELAEGQEPAVSEPAKKSDPEELERYKKACDMLLKGLRVAVHHLDTGKPIAMESLKNLQSIIDKVS